MTITDSQAPPEPTPVVEQDAPLVELLGLLESPQHRVNQLVRLLYEVAPLVIIAGFFWLEGDVDRQMSGPARILVLLLLVLVEFGLISAWNLLRTRLGYH